MNTNSFVSRVNFIAILFGLLLCASACAQNPPVRLAVDASDAPRNILHANLHIPAPPGKLTLLYPKWIPGEHGPTGPIIDLVNLKTSIAGEPVAWRRDPEEMYAIHLDVPAQASAVDVSLDFLLSTHSGTPNLADICWNQVLLYPQGPKASDLNYAVTLKLPAGWQFASALPRAGEMTNNTVEFSPVSLETLVDSPLIAGTHFRSVDLSPGSDVPHHLQIVGETAAALEIKPDDQKRFSNLVQEAEALFDSHHYRGYQFLLTLSEQVGYSGLEHHESSDDRNSEQFLTNAQYRRVDADLLAHEMVHSGTKKGISTYSAGMKEAGKRVESCPLGGIGGAELKQVAIFRRTQERSIRSFIRARGQKVIDHPLPDRDARGHR